MRGQIDRLAKAVAPVATAGGARLFNWLVGFEVDDDDSFTEGGAELHYEARGSCSLKPTCHDELHHQPCQRRKDQTEAPPERCLPLTHELVSLR